MPRISQSKPSVRRKGISILTEGSDDEAEYEVHPFTRLKSTHTVPALYLSTGLTGIRNILGPTTRHNSFGL